MSEIIFFTMHNDVAVDSRLVMMWHVLISC
jgi:hypothetical protein